MTTTPNSKYLSPSIAQLITALRCLPGIGIKSAQRMAFYLLEHKQQHALTLARALTTAVETIQHCQRCRTFSERAMCPLCQDKKRDQTLLCIVETPIDLLVIEQIGSYRGYYFVLMGRLSPLDGIGPDDIGMPELANRLRENKIKEVIIATNPTVEGTTTAHYIAELCQQTSIHCSRIAHGVPLGSELEYLDSATLGKALTDRVALTNAQ